eukprot:300362_1
MQILSMILIQFISGFYCQSYILNNYQLSAADSDALCLFQYSEHLASIHDTTQQLEATSFANVSFQPWIGLKHDITQNNFYWEDKTPWNYGTILHEFPWNAPTEPNNNNGLEHCVHLNKDGAWNDFVCDNLKSSLCNYPHNNYIFQDPPHIIRTPLSSNIIGYVDILDEVHITFDIIIHSWRADDWQNILRIGETENLRFPAIFIWKQYQTFQFTFSEPNGNWNPVFNADTNFTTLGAIYHINFYRSQTKHTIYVNNAVLLDVIAPSHQIVFNQPIYLCVDWTDCADATISNLTIMTKNTPEPYKFNYLCDAQSRITVVSGTWIINETDCSVQQTNSTYEGAIAWMGDNDVDALSLQWTNYKIETKITINENKWKYWAQAGILFRAKTLNDAYSVGIRSRFNDSIKLGWYNVFNFFILSETTWNISNGIEFILRVDVIDNNIKIYINNQFAVEHNDTNLDRGSVGFRTWQAAATFSSLKITFVTDNKLYTTNPTINPTNNPINPTYYPTINPTYFPTINPTIYPNIPTVSATEYTKYPLSDPTVSPSVYPTDTPILEGMVQTETTVNNVDKQSDVVVSFLEDKLMTVVVASIIGLLLFIENKVEGNCAEMTRVTSVSADIENGETVGEEIGAVKSVTFDQDMTVKMWLNSINLSEYYDLFKQQEMSIIKGFNDSDLEKIGIQKMDDRKKLLQYIEGIGITIGNNIEQSEDEELYKMQTVTTTGGNDVENDSVGELYDSQPVTTTGGNDNDVTNQTSSFITQ